MEARRSSILRAGTFVEGKFGCLVVQRTQQSGGKKANSWLRTRPQGLKKQEKHTGGRVWEWFFLP